MINSLLILEYYKSKSDAKTTEKNLKAISQWILQLSQLNQRALNLAKTDINLTTAEVKLMAHHSQSYQLNSQILTKSAKNLPICGTVDWYLDLECHKLVKSVVHALITLPVETAI